MRKRWRNVGIAAGVLLAGAALAGPVRVWNDVRAAEGMYRRGEAGRRALALRHLASGRTGRGDAVVREALCGPDAKNRRDAARAICAARRTDLAAELQAAWQREADPPTRSSIIFYWSQLAGRAAEPILRPMMTGDEPWTALAAAKALMRLGDPQATERVLSAAAGPGTGPDSGWRVDARRELQSLAVPMAAMIGQKVEIAGAPPAEWSAEQVTELQAWWRVHVTPRLLSDYLAWRNDKPDSWRKADLLLHEWKGRFGGFLRTQEPTDEGR
jgi:hypothetical protein